MIWLLLLQLVVPFTPAPFTPTVYFPETQDSLRQSAHLLVQVGGMVGSADRDDNVQSFRLFDNHGHYIRCVLVKGTDPPRVGAEIVVFGARRFWPNGSAEIDPVAKITPVEDK